MSGVGGDSGKEVSNVRENQKRRPRLREFGREETEAKVQVWNGDDAGEGDPGRTRRKRRGQVNGWEQRGRRGAR